MDLGQQSSVGPAIAFSPQLNCLVFAWRGVGNNQLNIALSTTLNISALGPVWTSPTETTSDSPALGVAPNGNIFVAWKGSNNDDLSIAKVEIDTGHPGVPTATGLSGKTSFLSVTDTAPGLFLDYGGHTYVSFSKGENLSFITADTNPPQAATVSNESTYFVPLMMDCANTIDARGIFIAWVGTGNFSLNVRLLTGGSFYWGGDQTKYTSTNTTPSALSIAYIPDRMYLAWRGSSGNNQLNVMREDQWPTNAALTLTETTDSSPAICAYKDINGVYYLALAWKDAGSNALKLLLLNENLGVVAQTKTQWNDVKVSDVPKSKIKVWEE